MGLMLSNCIVEAAREFWRMHRAWRAEGRPSGGEPYIWIRSSRLAGDWVPHVGIGHKDGARWVMRSFKPDNPNPLRWWQLPRVMFFVGRWVEGDQ